MVVMYFSFGKTEHGPWDHFHWKLYRIIDALESISEKDSSEKTEIRSWIDLPGKMTPNLAWLSSLKSLWPVKITEMPDLLTSSRKN